MANGDGFFLIKVAGVWTQYSSIPNTLVTNLTKELARVPVAQPGQAQPISPITPSSFGSFPTGPLAVPADIHRVNTLAAILGA